MIKIENRIGGELIPAKSGSRFLKVSPHDGTAIVDVARSSEADIDYAVSIAKEAQTEWARSSAVSRGKILLDIAAAMSKRTDDIARIVALETGKSVQDAQGEADAAIQLAEFFAGEGMRLFGQTMQSSNPNKMAMTIREPLGVAGLIIAANTPIANAAWKIFPALICGNCCILKAAEDTPATADILGEIAADAGLPPGVLNILHGYGAEAGAPLVQHPDIDVISFTGSSAVGRKIAASAGALLKRVSLELGGKNPLVVCDDADFDLAIRWSLLSSFSNAGQRCAASSRIIVFDSIYENFRNAFVLATEALTLGPSNENDLGPVINEQQLNTMLRAIETMESDGAKILTGGQRLFDDAHKLGFYLAPTIIENIARDNPQADRELFGPITCLYRATDFDDAVTLANNTAYGLTAAIHTRDVNRAIVFGRSVKAGVVNVNAGTHGSEPHFPFGGVGQSGNGTREPGTEALNVYSELKSLSFTVNQTAT